jgi:hypothetical protein
MWRRPRFTRLPRWSSRLPLSNSDSEVITGRITMTIVRRIGVTTIIETITIAGKTTQPV